MLVQTANFRKKFRSLANQHLRVLLKHAKCGGSRFKWVVSREGGKKQRGTGGVEHGAGRSIDGLDQDAPATGKKQQINRADLWDNGPCH
jgi:hypothetical protein